MGGTGENSDLTAGNLNPDIVVKEKSRMVQSQLNATPGDKSAPATSEATPFTNRGRGFWRNSR